MYARYFVLSFAFATTCVLFANTTKAAPVGFVDDASSDGLSDYVLSVNPVTAGVTHNGGGYYELPDTANRGTVALTRAFASGGFYDTATAGKITMTAWVDGLSSSRTYLYWVNDPTTITSNSVATTGYGVHTRVRNSDDSPTWLAYVPDKTNFFGRVQSATPGGVNGDLLITSLSNAVIDIDDTTNPYTRLEWTIDRIGSDNDFSFKMYRGDTPEFTDGAEVIGAAWSYLDAGSLFTAGYLGIGINDIGGETTGVEINLHRLQVIEEITSAPPTDPAPIPEPASAVALTVMGLSLMLARRRRNR